MDIDIRLCLAWLIVATSPALSIAWADKGIPKTASAQSFALACETGCVGDPISPSSGNLYEQFVDYSSKGAYPLFFFRAYNSLIANEDSSPDGAFENLGHGWTTNISQHLFISLNSLPPGQNRVGPCMIQGHAYSCPPADPMSDRPYVIGISLWGQDGRMAIFYYDGVGKPDIGAKFINEPGTAGELRVASVSTKNIVTGYLYILADGSQQTYDGAGRLMSTADPHGLKQTYQYDTGGELGSLSDSFGRKLRFAYDDHNRLAALTDPAGGVIEYGYDSLSNLISVDFPDQTKILYLYEDRASPHAMTGIVDQDGNRYVTWQFDAQGRAISSALADGTDQVSIIYNSDGSSNVIDADKSNRHLTFTTINGRQEMATSSVQSSAPCPYCNVKAITYDKNGFVDSIVSFDGGVTRFNHDPAGRELSRSSQNGTDTKRAASQSQVSGSQSDTGMPKPNSDIGGEPSVSYDARGLPIAITDSHGSKTSLSYDRDGNLAEAKDPQGQLTRFTRYDAHGNPLSIIDPQGVETIFVYDREQHLLSRASAGHKTEFNYDGVGQLIKIITSTGAYVGYSYDISHRLTSIQDSLGDTISFTLNEYGKPVGEHVFNQKQSQLDPQHVIDQVDSIFRL